MGWEFLVGALISLWSAHQGADAASEASQQQVQSANTALQLQQRQYADQQRNQYPFLAAGQKSVRRLSQLMGLGDLGNYTEQAPVALGQPGSAVPFPSLPHAGTPEPTPPHSGPGAGPAPGPAAPPVVAAPRPGATPPPIPSLPHAGTPVPAPPPVAVPRPGTPAGPGTAQPRSLADIGSAGSGPQASGNFSVTDPNGMTHTFPTAIQLASFKQQVGL